MIGILLSRYLFRPTFEPIMQHRDERSAVNGGREHETTYCSGTSGASGAIYGVRYC